MPDATVCSDVMDSAWASNQIHKIAAGACAGNAGNVFPTTVEYQWYASRHVHDACAVMHAGIAN